MDPLSISINLPVRIRPCAELLAANQNSSAIRGSSFRKGPGPHIMIKMRSLPLYALASACLFSTSAFAQQNLAQFAAPTVRIVNPINENQLVTLTHTVHPLANAAN